MIIFVCLGVDVYKIFCYKKKLNLIKRETKNIVSPFISSGDFMRPHCCMLHLCLRASEAAVKTYILISSSVSQSGHLYQK